MAMRSKINRGNEIRTKGKSMGRERSGAAQPSSRPAPRAALFMAGRVALMLAGIAVMALGIDVVVKADLGNSPISATPNVLSLGFPAVSFGTFMLGWQCALVLVQVALLRRDFRLVDLWQIPISVFFGLCIYWFMALLDLHAYIDEKDKCFAAYEDRQAWAEKMIVNISKAGYFSSDRTIAQYNQDIWHLK